MMLENKSKIIAIVNQKGGVGKTTTAVNLSTALAAIYKKTLLIDLDPQGNATSSFGIAIKDRKNTIYEVLVNEVNINDAVVNTEIPHLSLIPSTVDLAAAEIELISIPKKEYVFKDKLQSLNIDYDYIIIDCPPSLGMLTVNALAAAMDIVIPLQCEYFALEGLSHLLKTIDLIKARVNRAINILGIILTMHDKRNKLTQQVENDVRECLGDYVFNTCIPRNIRISEAPSHGKPVLLYDVKCIGSISYLKLAKEILEKINTNNMENA